MFFRALVGGAAAVALENIALRYQTGGPADVMRPVEGFATLYVYPASAAYRAPAPP